MLSRKLLSVSSILVVITFCFMLVMTTQSSAVWGAVSSKYQLFTTDSHNITTFFPRQFQTLNSTKSQPTFTDPNQHLLETGFPVQMNTQAGTYHSGPARHTLVEDLDGDGLGDIIKSEVASGPIHAINYLGQELPGYPVQNIASGSAYPAAMKGLLLAGSWEGFISAFSGTGTPLWVRRSANFNENPPSVFGNNNQYQMFIDENDRKLHSYNQLGEIVPGWPVSTRLNQDTHTAAIADLNDDGSPEVVTVSGDTSLGTSISVFEASGSALPNWPVTLPGGFADQYPAIGNVGVHGEMRIVVVDRLASAPFTPRIIILTPTGQIEKTILLPEVSGANRAAAVALADLNRDGKLDIVAQFNSANSQRVIVIAYDRNGQPLPGWPFETSGRIERIGNSAVVIGDVDGDSLPEVIFTTQKDGSSTTGYIYVLNHDGTPVETWNQTGVYPIGFGAVPAIANIDKDRHNEIIITGEYWDGFTGSYDSIWVYDLNKGKDEITHSPNIEWGQFMHDAQHTGFHELWVN